MEYIRRIVDQEIDKRIKAFNAINIIGPKGSGKTRTAQERCKTIIEFSIPTDVYEQAKVICERNGLTVEEACVRFIEATVACRDLPFPYTQQDIEYAK